MPAKSPAQALIDKADKRLRSSTWLSFSDNKYEEAGDLYQQAANAFKLEKSFREAGDAFAREAECRENSKEIYEAANSWWNAAKVYKIGYPDLAITALEKTVTQFTKCGRFRQAADREKEIGQIYLRDESPDLRKACESFEKAAEWYAQEDAVVTANACYKDAADLHAELEEYPQAIARYEQVASHSLTSNLTKYNVKAYWLCASLCALAMNDTVLAKRNMAKYGNQDTTFPSTREAKFASVIIEAVAAQDLESFTAAVVDFDSVTKLDNWKTAILLKIRRSIGEEDTLR